MWGGVFVCVMKVGYVLGVCVWCVRCVLGVCVMYVRCVGCVVGMFDVGCL